MVTQAFEFKVLSIEGAPEDAIFLLPPDIADMVMQARVTADWGEILGQILNRPKECSMLKVGGK